MKITKLYSGVYRVEDSKGTWVAAGGYATINGKWTAYDCSNRKDCTTVNNWGVQFNTFKDLKKFSQEL
jgi:hypothetical protein